MRGVSGKKWYLLYKEKQPSRELINKYGKLLAQLLVNRGFDKDAEIILDPKLSYIPTYRELAGLEEALERIVEAVKKKKRIIIYGDYDVDGITGTSILYKTLKKIGAKVYPILPNRQIGYGLNVQLMKIFENYGDFLITVDNGTSAVNEIDNSKLDTVVIDHHNVPKEIPKKAILVNPKIGSSVESLKSLSSSALTFYLACAIIREFNLEEDPRTYLDLVALGLLADYMPLNVVNRIFAVKGLNLLEHIAKGNIKKAGVKALLDIASLKGKITSKDVYFSIAPRLNSAGRISKAYLALKLLLEEDENKAKRLAYGLNELNKRRQVLTKLTYEEARRKAESQKDKNFIVVWDENWHPGILGIVAGRLAGELGKPVAVFAKGNKKATGSVRSVEDVEIYSKISLLSSMFIKWGGHDKAMGLTLPSTRLEEFREKVNLLFEETQRLEISIPVDMELEPSEINEEVLSQISRLEPFGEGNPYPVFLTTVKNYRINSQGKVVINGAELTCWNNELIKHIEVGKRILYSIEGKSLVLVDVEYGIS